MPHHYNATSGYVCLVYKLTIKQTLHKAWKINHKTEFHPQLKRRGSTMEKLIIGSLLANMLVLGSICHPTVQHGHAHHQHHHQNPGMYVWFLQCFYSTEIGFLKKLLLVVLYGIEHHKNSISALILGYHSSSLVVHFQYY